MSKKISETGISLRLMSLFALGCTRLDRIVSMQSVFRARRPIAGTACRTPLAEEPRLGGGVCADDRDRRRSLDVFAGFYRVEVGYGRTGIAINEQAPQPRVMPHGDIPDFAPPPMLTRDEADRIVEIARIAVDRVHASL
jgi:adenosylmethionine-8-amino-7-oxononanoate aminotransferase